MESGAGCDGEVMLSSDAWGDNDCSAAEVTGGDGEDLSEVNSSDELEDESPTSAGGSLSGMASADVI
jgi:hypothetical protein